MRPWFRALPAVVAVSFFWATTARSEQEMVANPYYKFWAGSRAGDKAIHLEQTKLTGADGKVIPGTEDEKRIEYKLVRVNGEKAVVEMVVTEKDILGFIQAAPTQHIYPAKLKKADYERIGLTVSDQKGEETLKVGDVEVKTRTVSGSGKGSNGETVDFKLWLSDDVPGSVVKQVRTSRHKSDVVAETVITLKGYTKAEKKSE